jgi:cytochrome c553
MPEAGFMKGIVILTIAVFGAALTAHADNSKAHWLNYCAMCHGKTGKGNTPAGRILGAPNLQSPKVQASFTDEQAFKAIKEGIVKDDRRKMKSFSSELTDQDIHDMVKYLRVFKKGG